MKIFINFKKPLQDKTRQKLDRNASLEISHYSANLEKAKRKINAKLPKCKIRSDDRQLEIMQKFGDFKLPVSAYEQNLIDKISDKVSVAHDRQRKGKDVNCHGRSVCNVANSSYRAGHVKVLNRQGMNDIKSKEIFSDSRSFCTASADCKTSSFGNSKKGNRKRSRENSEAFQNSKRMRFDSRHSSSSSRFF